MTRKIQGLKWARGTSPPGFAKGPGPKVGAKAQGLRYERAVARELPQALKGLWWEFEDGNGPGWCQTDFFIPGKSEGLVLECKLGYSEGAWKQLELLYLPVVQLATGLKIQGLQVTKLLRGPGFAPVGAGVRVGAKPPGVRVGAKPPGVRVVNRLESGLALARLGHRVVVHWTGLGPILERN